MAGGTQLFITPSSSSLMTFFIQVVIILFVIRFLGRLLIYIHQPQVIGEILAGILLGPTCLGSIYGFNEAIFPSTSLTFLQTLSQISLVFYMFFLGLELDGELMFGNWKHALPITIAKLVLPFCTRRYGHRILDV